MYEEWGWRSWYRARFLGLLPALCAMATTPVTAVFTGDASLRSRPMGRVLEPLKLFGAEYSARERGLMPVTLKGARQSICVEHTVNVASAQVKSAMLLAALNAPGLSRISQGTLTRDHTERMLTAFGARDFRRAADEGGEIISLMGEAELKGVDVHVPRDPSSAAFLIVAGLIVPGSEITLPGILLNPRRTGLIDTLLEMGAQYRDHPSARKRRRKDRRSHRARLRT